MKISKEITDDLNDREIATDAISMKSFKRMILKKALTNVEVKRER